MDIRPAEISEILKQQIAGFDADANVAEVGTVLTVGDGIARVYGLQNVMAGELVDFPLRRRGVVAVPVPVARRPARAAADPMKHEPVR